MRQNRTTKPTQQGELREKNLLLPSANAPETLIFRCGCKQETLGCKRLKIKRRISFATRLISLRPSFTSTFCFQTSRYGILSCLNWILIHNRKCVSTGSSNSYSCAVRFAAVLLQSVLVTDWSDANTIKSDKPEKKHEAWRKDNNKPNFCGNVRLQGKYYKQKPSVRFTWKAMKEGIGRALEIFSVIKISLAIVCHLESAELTKLQEF